MIDGVPTQLISGALHYFRIHPEQWRDRLEKARQMGLNCVETYFCWNLHEAHPGEFDFSGILDFERFIRTAQEVGLYVIVRPGPYICAEWTNGGIPPWVMALPGCRCRCFNPVYLEAVEKYFDVLLPKIASLQYTGGGPVILAAVENEYGSYGRDKEYLQALKNMFLKHGFDIPLITADGGEDCSFVLGGSLPGCPVTLTFGAGNVMAYFEQTRPLRPDVPDICMEYWVGAFDHWGEPHHKVETVNAAEKLDQMLAAGASVNLYMFCGGTNFGFNNGANQDTLPYVEYTPDVTSYDYDAPLRENGNTTEKYFAFQQVIRKYRPDAPFGTPVNKSGRIYAGCPLTEYARLFDNLSTPHRSRHTETMEHYGQNQGFILYETELHGHANNPELPIRIYGLRDRAQVFLDGEAIATFYRTEKEHAVNVRLDQPTHKLSVLVENTGYINYGPSFGRDFKGILDGITVNYQYQDDYTAYPLPLEDIGNLTFAALPKEFTQKDPVFYRGILEVDAPADTYLKFPGVRGVVWVNGFCIGRYWNIGPDTALYIPGPVLKPGRNEFVVLELHELTGSELEFVPDSAITR